MSSSKLSEKSIRMVATGIVLLILVVGIYFLSHSSGVISNSESYSVQPQSDPTTTDPASSTSETSTSEFSDWEDCSYHTFDTEKFIAQQQSNKVLQKYVYVDKGFSFAAVKSDGIKELLFPGDIERLSFVTERATWSFTKEEYDDQRMYEAAVENFIFNGVADKRTLRAFFGMFFDKATRDQLISTVERELKSGPSMKKTITINGLAVSFLVRPLDNSGPFTYLRIRSQENQCAQFGKAFGIVHWDGSVEKNPF